MELTITDFKQAQYSNSYCMLKGLQNNYDALIAHKLSKTIQEVWLHMSLQLHTGIYNYYWQKGRPEGCCTSNSLQLN